jgi:hypothetical protein
MSLTPGQSNTSSAEEGSSIPSWVDKCVKRYIDKGFTKDEAWKRCQGAYEKQKGRDEKKKKKKILVRGASKR